MRMFKDNLEEHKGQERQRGSVLLEACIVFPVMFIIIMIIIYVGNLYFQKAQIDDCVERAAIKGAACVVNPQLYDIWGKADKMPEGECEPYRYLFGKLTADTSLSKLEANISDELIRDIDDNVISFFINMEPELESRVGGKVAEYKNYLIYGVFKTRIKYSIKVPIDWLISGHNKLSFSSHAEVAVTDVPEFVRNIDMIMDMFAGTELGKSIGSVFEKVNTFVEKFAGKTDGGGGGSGGTGGSPKPDSSNPPSSNSPGTSSPPKPQPSGSASPGSPLPSGTVSPGSPLPSGTVSPGSPGPSSSGGVVFLPIISNDPSSSPAVTVKPSVVPSVKPEVSASIRPTESTKPSEKPKDDIIRDGSHLENGKLKADITYQTGEYEYIYKTDSKGRISNWSTDNLQLTEREERLPHDPNTPGKEKGDHAGHLAGDRFGGSPGVDNLVSQSSHVNLSEYKKIENQWAKAIKEGKTVTTNVEVIYDGDSLRPKEFKVKYTIDGEAFYKRILNDSVK